MEFRNTAASAATVVAFASAAFAHKGSRLVGRVHAKGVKICFRAGDTPEAVARMLALGLDYIPTNGMVPL